MRSGVKPPSSLKLRGRWPCGCPVPSRAFPSVLLLKPTQSVMAPSIRPGRPGWVTAAEEAVPAETGLRNHRGQQSILVLLVSKTYFFVPSSPFISCQEGWGWLVTLRGGSRAISSTLGGVTATAVGLLVHVVRRHAI